MCGITGIYIQPSRQCERQLANIEAMNRSLLHRGPDDGGQWCDPSNGIALGHRRLSIIDLSAEGHQPMVSHGGDLVIVYNGETYNFAALRQELLTAGVRFRGSSDTEVILAAFERYGIEATMGRLAGMFAMAVWDRRNSKLHLVRDRMGKKPLYIAATRHGYLFASQPKAFLACPEFDPEIEPAAISAMLRQGWIPDHGCIWKNAFKLPPGGMLTLGPEDLRTPGVARLKANVKRYWSLEEVAIAAAADPMDASDDALADQLDDLLRVTVGERMVADVPLGAFLSGGIDSSLVVALMQQASSQPVRTFSIGFAGTHYDEAPLAGRVARHLGCEHVEFDVTADEAMRVIPDLGAVWDEPFADESQIPTLILARLARQHVTVALTGDGGDECFAGYTRHVMLQRLAPVLRVPMAIRRPMSAALNGINADLWDKLTGLMPLPSGVAHGARSENLQKLASTLGAAGDAEFHDALLRFGRDSVSSNLNGAMAQICAGLDDPFDRMIYRDMANYLPGDILVKTDRATMAVGLEARCPLLDHRLVEFALRLPRNAKVRHNQGKWILRQVLSRYVPEELYDRPKHGFNVPIGQWLREPLRNWAQDLLFKSQDPIDVHLDLDRVQTCWAEHVSGKRDNGREIWAIVMLKNWYESLGAVRAGAQNIQADAYRSTGRDSFKDRQIDRTLHV